MRDLVFILIIIGLCTYIFLNAYREPDNSAIHSGYKKDIQINDSVHASEKQNLLIFISHQDQLIDSLKNSRKKDKEKLYATLKFFDTISIVYIDSFLAANYDSLARFRYGIAK